MDKRDLFSIGYVAKMFHISVGTLRHYERSGLLSPEYIDPHTGYRYYMKLEL
ncbi:MerR family DNA-binding transcriptional regulator [uncultured Clostridium sp.]|uniref:MerR family DNA-binding transcriptional regulator n=1 Tax=uncultured Clostridium sp. TaxID=59620 RepID=UPI0025E09D0F|nr:MerR family DNA-binding transcriptional regulator [uncultured Clostridium sp.]